MLATELRGPRGRLLNTYRILATPFETSLAWRDRFGDPLLVRAVNGNIVMTGRAEHAKAVFGAAPETFAPFGAKVFSPIVGPNSVLILGGEAHRRERKLLMPPFHGARMRAYAETMREVALRRFAGAVDRPTTMQALAQQITLEIIVRAIFGVEDSATVDQMSKNIVEAVEAVHPAFLFAPWLQRELGGIGPYARFRRLYARADLDLQKIIEERRRRGSGGEDILGLLLDARYEDGTAMKDEDIKDELRTLLLAGHETTAMTLAFLVDFLCRDREAHARAKEEALSASGGAETLAALPYLDAVAKETLRFRPIITEIIRTIREPFALGDLVVPHGMHIGVSMILAHFDPDTFVDPARYYPQRFLDRKFGPAEYVPFGGGNRRCIGAAFADMEMRIVVGALLAAFDVELLAKEISRPVRRNLTMGPHDGVPLLLRRRARAQAAA